MALANCPRCGTLFNKITRDICQKCIEEEEALLRETQKYLREHRNASVFEVMNDLDVDRAQLDKWSKEKRISILQPDQVVAKRVCMYCGREVPEGSQICRTCQIKKLSDKKSPFESSKEPETEEEVKKSRGMFYKKRSE